MENKVKFKKIRNIKLKLGRPKKKISPRKKLIAKLDRLVSQIVVLAAGNRCERCGKKGGSGSGKTINCHHIFSRSNLSVRWYLPDLVALDAGCHCLNDNSAHKAPIEFIEWLKKKRGIKWYNDLRKKANEIKKWEIWELEELVKAFEGELKELCKT